MRHVHREVAVVGEEEEAFGVEVEAADRAQAAPHPLGHQVDDGGTPFRILAPW